MQRPRSCLTPRALLVCVLPFLVSITAPGSSPGATPQPAPIRNDFSDFLLTRDVVVRGAVVRVERVQRQRTGGCGASGLGAIGGRLITVLTDSVIVGSPQSRTVQVFSYDERRDAKVTDVPGARVLLFGQYPCDDPEMLYGDIAIIGRDGSLRVPEGESIALPGAADVRAPRFPEVMAAVGARRDHGADLAFEGARAVALVKIVDIQPMERSYAARPELVRWIAGGPVVMPATIHFQAIPQCGGVTSGQTMLLPIPAGFAGGNLSVPWCSERLVVRDGQVPGLSARLDHLENVLVLRDGRVHLVTEREGR